MSKGKRSLFCGPYLDLGHDLILGHIVTGVNDGENIGTFALQPSDGCPQHTLAATASVAFKICISTNLRRG